MPKSVLDAIRMGIWDYEPEWAEERRFESTRALPGTREKVEVMAARAESGMPLWHDADRIAYDEGLED